MLFLKSPPPPPPSPKSRISREREGVAVSDTTGKCPLPPPSLRLNISAISFFAPFSPPPPLRRKKERDVISSADYEKEREIWKKIGILQYMVVEERKEILLKES